MGLTHQAERRRSSFSKHLPVGDRIEGRRISYLEHSTRRPFSCLARYLRVGVLRPVRNPPMMSLSKLKEKDHYNDLDDFVSATSR
jgi:hypothetical protein